MKTFRLLMIMLVLGGTSHLKAAVYVDPSSASTLMTLLAPVFILVSALGLHFKRGLKALVQRLFQRPAAPRDGQHP
jgi:hypothetical protein